MKPTRILEMLFLFGICASTSFLVFFRLSELMPFIGDQAWFYISARDLIVERTIPLVGITASHTWLHQGALWTYILAPILLVFNFNPVAPAYVTGIMHVVTVLLFYQLGAEMISKKAALIMAVLFASSPLAILYARMPYHTTLIPLITLLLIYSVYMWTKGKITVFPYIFLLLGILYNLELATIVLWPILIVIGGIGYVQKEKWVRAIRPRLILKSFLFFLVPMIPILIYDVNHGFPQTFLFGGWLVYRTLSLFLPIQLSDHAGHSFQEILAFLYTFNGKFIFGMEYGVALVIVICAFGLCLWRLRRKETTRIIVLLFFVVPLVGFLVNKTPSQAYLPLFFPGVLLMIGWALNTLMSTRPRTLLGVGIVGTLALLNGYWLLSNSYFSGTTDGYGVSMKRRWEVAEDIVRVAGQRPYSIEETGEGKKYENTILNTTYLTWILKNQPSKDKQELHFKFYETATSLTVRKEG